MQNEVQRVVTLWGDCGWSDHDEGFNRHQVMRGYRSLNEEINGLAEQVTIHSVSYAHIVLSASMPGTLRMFATVLYSCSAIVQLYGSDEVTHQVDIALP